jgi:hypothetical protein
VPEIDSGQVHSLAARDGPFLSSGQLLIIFKLSHIHALPPSVSRAHTHTHTHTHTHSGNKFSQPISVVLLVRTDGLTNDESTAPAGKRAPTACIVGLAHLMRLTRADVSSSAAAAASSACICEFQLILSGGRPSGLPLGRRRCERPRAGLASSASGKDKNVHCERLDSLYDHNDGSQDNKRRTRRGREPIPNREKTYEDEDGGKEEEKEKR